MFFNQTFFDKDTKYSNSSTGVPKHKVEELQRR